MRVITIVSREENGVKYYQGLDEREPMTQALTDKRAVIEYVKACYYELVKAPKRLVWYNPDIPKWEVLDEER